MIPLDSPRWLELGHAYGPAGDIPDLLRTVYSNPYNNEGKDKYGDEPWFTLWSSLCHQGDVYDASAAAVPHLVQAALRATSGIMAYHLIYLPVCIEKSRIERPYQLSPTGIDPDFMQAYFEAVCHLKTVCELAAKTKACKSLNYSVREATRLLSRKRGSILPEQKTEDEPGGLFAWAAQKTKQAKADE